MNEKHLETVLFFQAVASLKSEALNKELRRASNPISHFQVFKCLENPSIPGWMMNVGPLLCCKLARKSGLVFHIQRLELEISAIVGTGCLANNFNL